MKNFLIAVLSILVLSCNETDDNSNSVTIESTLIAKDNLYGAGNEGIIEQNLVISDQATWDALMTQMNSVNNVTNTFTETVIDFSEYKIIAVLDAIKANAGHSIELDITSNSESIFVNVTDLTPGGNATTVITQPFHIVKIQVTNLPIVFE